MGLYRDFYEPDPFDHGEPVIVEYKRCGKGGLHWEDDNGRWVLVTSKGEIHQCDMQKAAVDDFEVVE